MAKSVVLTDEDEVTSISKGFSREEAIMGSAKIIERFHVLFVSDVRTVYENLVYYLF